MAQLIDLTGQRFGNLVVIERANDIGGYVAWKCRCDCGNELVMKSIRLRNRKWKMCKNCESKQRQEARVTDRRLYGVWEGICSRCNTPSSGAYEYYGGRGIKICKEWKDYLAFEKWALSSGYDETAPHGQCTLDRIDVNGDYEPNNCRWITQKQQSLNTRRSRVLMLNGESMTAKEWADKLGMPYGRLISRVNKLGWSDERALCESALIVRRPRKKTANE